MTKEIDKVNLDLLREAYGRVVYTQTTHEYAAQTLQGRNNRFKWFNIIINVLAFGGLIGVLVTNESVIKIITAVLSSLSLASSIYQLSFNPETEAIQHKAAARELWYVREKYKNLIADLMNSTIDKQEVVKRRDALLEELKLIYKFSPATDSDSYKKAQKALQMEDEQTFGEEELDLLLPESLRLSSKKKE